MNRRGFFKFVTAIAATSTVDPERLLWIPGQKLISIPSPRPQGLVVQGVDEAYEQLNRLLDSWSSQPLIFRIPDPLPYYPGTFGFTETISRAQFRRRYPSRDGSRRSP